MGKQRVFVLEGEGRQAEWLCTFMFHPAGLEIETVNAADLQDVVSTDVPKLFQQAHGWACKRGGFVSAFPTFLREGPPEREDHRLVLLTPDVAVRADATEKELWPNEPLARHDVGHFFRVIHDQAVRLGHATGYPMFMTTEKDGQVVHQFVCLRRPLAMPFELELPDFGRGPFVDVPRTFSTVNKWALEHGYAAGLPNFHLRSWNRGWGERTPLTRSEQDLNHLLANEGWRVVRVDPLKVSGARDALVYLLEQG